MAADPLKEVLEKVIQERRQQISELNGQLAATFDPVVRADLEAALEKLRSEQNAAEQALDGQRDAVQESSAPPTPSPIEQPRTAVDTQLLARELQAQPPPPRAPTRAALEAQIKELQVELLELARVVERAGPDVNPMDLAQLKQIREKLQNALNLVGGTELMIEVGELPPKPTLSQISEADRLVKNARVAKMRGQKQAASDLLRQAAEVAPGAVTVLEALGDDCMERGQAKPAAEIYAKAYRLEPGYPGLERKYAIAIGQAKNVVTLEEAMAMKFSDAPLAPGAASGWMTVIASLLVPGAGHILLGRYTTGLAYMGAWVGFLWWLYLVPKQVQDLVSSLAGKSSGFNPIVLIPLLGSLVLSVAAAWTCKNETSPVPTLKKGAANHPKPPMDLPFE
ncbi:MAG: hypothetical protein QOJ65_1380 [Fimbriimonadaceae bacterium]|jgi:tetratricopeptide (TPR) repeat protein|nr:hypothetical protein [Fimbriimonadaceae bacterium]